MKTILLAIDFSEGIENCCNYAIRIAGKFEAEIILFHSYFDKFLIAESSFPTGIETDTLINRKILEDIKTQAEADIKNIKGCIVEAHPQIEVRTELSGGNPDEEILRAALDFNVDLIMLGSSGKAEKGIFSGSISKKIIENTQIPVLSIPLGYTYKNITNILYPTEFLHDDQKIIKTILKLLTKFDIKIHCIHLIQPEKTEASNLMDALRAQFKDEMNKGLLCFDLLESKNFIDSLETYIEQNHINLIAFVAHKRGFLREIFTQKLTKKDLFHLRLPMLTLKQD
jgi:nucleotide-binding universal stress UspA family protein